MGDAIFLDALDQVVQEGIAGLHLPEEGSALTHDHMHQVDRDRVEQAELEGLTREGAVSTVRACIESHQRSPDSR